MVDSLIQRLKDAHHDTERQATQAFHPLSSPPTHQQDDTFGVATNPNT